LMRLQAQMRASPEQITVQTTVTLDRPTTQPLLLNRRLLITKLTFVAKIHSMGLSCTYGTLTPVLCITPSLPQLPPAKSPFDNNY
jgi:hypothetical protein